ncbi:MAG: cytochrome c biogenesis heme-transporting ATPase CcmA [Burkholderiales bacterium]|nr:cytochrome c biogenesis heme-transporting ATPase CcmA [Burkholderiales bacterium]
MLRASGLACARGERRLFAGVSFELGGGALLQVRGDNGSGKTSLLRMVCGLLAPAEGTVTWNGRDIRDLAEGYRARLAYVGHLNALKDELDPAENLRFAARVSGLPAAPADIDAALRALGLADARLPCRLLSQGEKRRAALARLRLSGSRPLWVLDEPFSALDAPGVALARSLVESHVEGGGAVLFTTHQDAGFAVRDVPTIQF